MRARKMSSDALAQMLVFTRFIEYDCLGLERC